ncbi:DUF397 domain-containing protein [Streptomyces sp. NPDC086077]|uniref:DUF397 domain-containing protein n=1 Tax=Streptomyces sp. NPDC086077 TaxID=3154862 RepID=UPI003439D828
MSMEESLDQDRPVWFRSSYSNGAGGECVECAPTYGGVLLRDSKSGMASVVMVGGETWSAFIGGLKCGGA